MSNRNRNRRNHPRPAEPDALLPPKVTGEHRWIAIATHTITGGQAAAAYAGARVVLGAETLVSLGLGCLDCEAPYDIARGRPCAAPAAAEFEDSTESP